ncbi:MAG: hypothetical protein KGQ79_08410 [Proteobacteria bacterium]|nr:hypothetical protein [Pseudomonadota bacterium]MBU6425243.1 hypothetical protein [Rhodospirillales bacterium]MDE2238744.1 hypothetical protein [Rhodospirillales bacterium]
MTAPVCTTITSQVEAAACTTSSPPTIWHMVPLSQHATDWVLILLTLLLVTILSDRAGKK